MHGRIMIFGNSGSGKSTLAKALASERAMVHLDLDSLAWEKGCPTQRRPLDDSRQDIEAFMAEHTAWVIEGCYADLLAIVAEEADYAAFLDPGEAVCVEHCRRRPWEPHKYPSKQAQDANLDMLLDWVGQYGTRTDAFSRQAHQTLYNQFAGNKGIFHAPIHVEVVPF